MIFPGRAPTVPLLGTPDGRLVSADGTTKSCATIPEDDETLQTPTEAEKAEADLISIDRVSLLFSSSFLRENPQSNACPSHHTCILRKLKQN